MPIMWLVGPKFTYFLYINTIIGKSHKFNIMLMSCPISSDKDFHQHFYPLTLQWSRGFGEYQLNHKRPYSIITFNQE